MMKNYISISAAIGYIALVYILGAVLASIIVNFIVQFSGNEAFSSNNQGICSLISDLLVIFPILWRYKKSYAEENKIDNVWVIILSMVVLGVLVGNALLRIIYRTPLISFNGNDELGNLVGLGNIITMFISAVILTPVIEEILFRGFLFKSIRASRSFWIAAICSSLLWSVVHFDLIVGVYTFLLGIIICSIYDRYDNIWLTILLHMVNNLLGFLDISVLRVANDRWGVLILVGEMMAIAGILFLLLGKGRREPDHKL